MKRILSLALSLILVAFVFVSCGTTYANEMTVTVNFEADGKQFYSKEVTVKYNDETPTVLMAVRSLMDTNDDIEIVLDDEAEPTTILDVDSYVDGDKFWDFTIGDDTYGTNGRASNAEIKEGDVITWGYMTADEFDALDDVAE